MPDYTGGHAVPRPGWTPGGSMADMAAWLTANRRPGDPLPGQFEWDGNRVVPRGPAWWEPVLQYGPYGVMGYGALAAAGAVPIAGTGAALPGTAVPASAWASPLGTTAATTAPAAGAGAAGTAAAATSLFRDPLFLGLTAGTQLLNYFGARNQANASREAAETLQQGVRDAIGAQGQMFGYSSNALLPFVNAGGQAVTELGNRLGFESAPFTPISAFVPPGVSGAPMQTSTPMPGGNPPVPAGPANPRGGVPFNAVGRVPMVSPDGTETAYVRPDQVQRYLARGARMAR